MPLFPSISGSDWMAAAQMKEAERLRRSKGMRHGPGIEQLKKIMANQKWLQEHSGIYKTQANPYLGSNLAKNKKMLESDSKYKGSFK